MNATLKEFYSHALVAKELEVKIKNLEECKLEETSLEELVKYESPIYPELQILKLKWEGFIPPRNKDTLDNGQSLEELQCILEKKKVKLSTSKYQNENMKKKLAKIRARCKELRKNVEMGRESFVRDKDFLFVTSRRFKESLFPSLEVHSRSVAALEEEIKRFQTEAERVKEAHHEIIRIHHQGQCLKKLIKKKRKNVDSLQNKKSVLEPAIEETKAKVAEHTQKLLKKVLLFVCSIGCVLARPEKPATFENTVPILVDEREPIDSYGGYGFKIVTGDGQSKSETSSRAGHGKMVTKGQYSFTHPTGEVHVLSYTAGVNGFEPASDMLPTPHPLEPWHLEQIRFAERQRRLQELAEARAALEARHKKQ